MGQSNSSVNEKKRLKFLDDHGFKLVRDRGHDTWVNQRIIDLVNKYGIDIDAPANFRSGNAQALGKVAVAGNPGDGTWKKSEKYIKWCHETADAIEKDPGAFLKKSEVARQFGRVAPPPSPNPGRRKNKPRHDTRHHM